MLLPKLEDGSTVSGDKLQLRRIRKFRLGKHFFVKEHLTGSFIDRAADLKHIRVRVGLSRRDGARAMRRSIQLSERSDSTSLPGQHPQTGAL